MFPPLADIYRLLPEIVACAFGIVVMLLDPFVPRAGKIWIARVALLGAVGALASVAWSMQFPGTAFYGLVIIDDFSIYLRLLIYAVAPLVVLGSVDYLEREGIHRGEYYALLLFATAGMGIMASANELMTAFIGLEMSSIASYVLAGFRRNALKSNEAAMKYFLLGSFATAFFLYGVALIYGATRTTNIQLLALEMPPAMHSAATLAILGMAMIFIGLAFKVATVPFQLWTPDAYEGAPTPVTALLSSGPKAAAFALMLRVFFTAFGSEQLSGAWFWAIWISAILTMFAGNFAALVQSNVKRMLAYSSIAHAGYILVAFAARTDFGIAAVLFYLAAYALMKIGAFTIVSHLGEAGERRLHINDYSGLGVKQPFTAAALSLYLLSLLGLPITAGFLGKLYIFNAALDAARNPALSRPMLALAILLAVNSVIAAYYYLRVIVAMYFHEPPPDWSPQPLPIAVAVVVLLTAIGTLYLGVAPDALRALAEQGALSLR
ncbi:MAG: NADH-quinone oxidoreductase subunit N [Candidatus Acidiferrales bacterium]